RVQGGRVDRAPVRRLPHARVVGARRSRGGRPGVQVLHERDRGRARQRRRPRRGHRPGGARRRDPVRTRARGLRQEDRPPPGDPDDARQDGDSCRGRTAARRAGRAAQGGRGARRPRGGHGQVFRHRGRPGERTRCDADPRRLRLLARVPPPAGLPRRPAPADRRRLERDPAARDRAPSPRAAHRLMDFSLPSELSEIRAGVRALCERFPGEYWRGLEPDRYPEEFVAALTENGWLSALIPEEFGGAGLSLTAASVILEEINASGGNAGACHAQMYIMGTILRHGSEEQKRRYLPKIATGELRLQAFGVTEPTAGSDT